MAVVTSVAFFAQLGAVAVALVIGGLAYRRRHKSGARTLTAIMLGVAGWNAARAASLGLTGSDLAMAAISVEYLGGVLTVLLELVFVLQFTGKAHLVRRRVLGLLALEPLALVVVLLTNDRHHLFYASVSAAEDPTRLQPVIEHGPLWTLHMLFVLTVLFSALALLGQKLRRAHSLHRSQTAAIVTAIVAPTIGVFLTVFADVGVALPLGFAVMGVALFVALFGFKLIDLTPVARATVMEELEAGILVVDDDDQVTDVNPRCRELFDLDPAARVVGRPAREVVPDRSLWDRYADRLDVEDEVTVETRAGRRTFRIRVSPVEGRRSEVVGRVFMIQEVTDRRRREREIERSHDRLRGVASVVSHDLRNPIQVAAGNAELIDDERADAVLDSLDRMEEIVDDVLSLAREDRTIEAQRPTALGDVARDAWDQVEAPNAELVVATDWLVESDATRLQRLFENLFRNAIEHARPDESEPLTVTVGAIDDPGGLGPDRVGFFVADDGRGVPRDVREDAFDAGVTTDDEGTGLGLSIVERIATAHDWDVSLAESEDGGARFEFRGVVGASPADENEEARSVDAEP